MSTPSPKRKVSVTLDDDLVAEIESEGAGLSHRVNEALRADLAEKRRRRALDTLLEHLAEQNGPLDTPEDEAEMHRLMELMGGPVDGGARQAGNA
jgi:antitoxin CcdA